MKVPVSVRTHRDLLLDIADTPHVGAVLLLLIALGPPLLAGQVAVVADFVRYQLEGDAWGFFTTEPPFLGELYFGLVFALAIPFHLVLSYRMNVRFEIFYMPAWAFAAACTVLFAVFGTSGA